MSLQNFNHNSAYGFNNPLQPVINPPIIADRAPLTSDFAEIGTQWIDQSNGDIYFLTKVVGSIATWIVGAGAATILTSLSVTPGPTVLGGDFTVNGTNVNLSSTADMNLTATGPGVDLNLVSLDGLVNISSSNGGVGISTNAPAPAGDMIISTDGGGQLSIGSTGTANDALLLNVNGDAVSSLGIINNTGTADATSHSTSAIHLIAFAGGIAIDAFKDFSITGDDSSIVQVETGDLNLLADVGDINLDADLGAINLTSETDIRIDPELSLTMAPSATVTDIEIGNITPIVPRDTTINGGAVISGIADTLNLASGGVNSNIASEKVVNIASGATDLGLTEVNIGDGNVLSGTHFVNISTGTNVAGVKKVDIGNAAGGTTINATGLITLDGGATGAVSVAHLSVPTAAPGPGSLATATNHVRVGSVTFSGFIQNASDTVSLTLTNSFITASSCILATATNEGAADAHMTLTRVFPGPGSALIVIKNNGAADLNGNMQLNFWVLS